MEFNINASELRIVINRYLYCLLFYIPCMIASVIWSVIVLLIIVIIAEHISNQQIIMQQVGRYSKIPFVCMYMYMSAKFRIVDCGFVACAYAAS